MSDEPKVEEPATEHAPAVTEPETPKVVEEVTEPKHEHHHCEHCGQVEELAKVVESLANPSEIPVIPEAPVDESPARVPWTHKGGHH